MVDFRVYRIAFAPTLLAVVTLMFSLQGVPAPLEPVRPPAGFDSGPAAATAREIVSRAPDRPPGSEGDAAIADLVTERFAAIRAGSVSEQEVAASIDGDDVTLRNIFITLPGESSETVVVLAGRDSHDEPGAASSAAATGTLIELAAALGATSHSKTYVLASTSGGTAGADGARMLLDGLGEAGVVEAVLVVSQPGAGAAQPPFIIATSTGPTRAAAQLTATAALAVQSQTGHADPGAGTLVQLARLAFPSGLGEQAPLIDAGFEAVAISSAGERPLDPAEDTAEDLSRAALDDFGRAAVSIVEAIDVAEASLEPGPQPYLEVGDNLVPGWAVALLGLTLLFPALVAAVDATGRALRRSEPLGGALAWAGSRALPALGGLGALYPLALVGLMPRPSFPFDPGRFEIDVRAAFVIVLIAVAVAASVATSGKLRGAAPPPRSSLVAALGITSVVAGLVAWLANPYLGLLLAPAVHAWLLGSAVHGRARVTVTALAAGLSLLPVALALGEVASALELGFNAPWTFMLMVANGQIGFWVALSLCFLVGALAGTVAASRRSLAAAS